jgi:hypothetical protein
MENVKDARLVTKHFDLLTACAIAWQMRNEAKVENHNIIEEHPDSIFKENNSNF